jgi:enolase
MTNAEFTTTATTQTINVTAVTARQILDSRGNPTVAVSLTLNDDSVVEASAPSGASTGAFEAIELRDGGESFGGLSVHNAVDGITNEIAPLLISQEWSGIREIDDAMRALDGTPNYSRLGANATVAISITASRAFALQAGLPLHTWIADVTGNTELLPVPHFNVLNGGAHADNDLDFQEFMIAPVGLATEELAVRAGAEIYHALAKSVRARYNATGLGDEGGFAPPISSPDEALDLIVAAITDAGYTPGIDEIAIAMDPAANGFYVGDGVYRIAGVAKSREELADYYEQLCAMYPIRSIEDGFAEDDHAGWKILFNRIGDKIQLVGDDLYVTDAARILDGAKNGYSNAVLIKPNQIGTVSQTFDAIAVAGENGMHSMVSHRSGETMDTFIADLVVGTGVGQIKTGAPARGERVAKYNRLMQIDAQTPGLRYGLV